MYNINMDDNFFQSNISFSDGPSQVGKKDHKPLIVGIICIIIGLTLGGAGVFGLTKLFEKECPGCNCPKPNNNISATGIDLDFLKLEENGKNIIYSPLSIRHGLSLLSAGADGETATEINNLLGDSGLPAYQNEADKLSLANAIFIKNDFKDDVLPTYVTTVENQYNSEIFYDSFTDTSTIDSWVNQKTFGLINNIGLEITPNASMVLANALAIQMDWQSKFDTSSTHGKSFYYENGEEVEATTMNKETSSNDIRYYVGDEATVLSMPLAKTDNGIQLEFDAIMPSGNLGEYIENATLDDLNNVLSNTASADTPENGIEISIPKFKFDYELGFEDDLNSLGITSAFIQEKADFSKMSTYPLYVSDSVHKANIDFSEDGIKAAAVTAFAMAYNAPFAEETKPVDVTIDRPFLFVIRDKDNNTIWFTGAVYQPNLWEDDAASYRSK